MTVNTDLQGTASPSEDNSKLTNTNNTQDNTQPKTGQLGRDQPTINIDHTSDNADRKGGLDGGDMAQTPDDGSYGDNDSIEDKNHPDYDTSTFTLNNMEGGCETAVTDMVPIPPDGGYGWVIVLAAFVSNFVVDGISNSFGAFMTIYQNYFGESKAVVSLIGSLLIGCYLLIGPFAGGLVNKYGARIVVIAGSIITGLAFAASIVAPNVYIFMLFYGLIGGAGFGLIYLPSIVCVSFYFEKKRSMATGIAVAGSGAGTFAMPPLCIYLINTFGWQVTVCVLAGISLSCAAFGALYKPLEAPQPSDDKEKEPLKSSDAETRPLSAASDEGIEKDAETKKRAYTAPAFGEMGEDAEAFAKLRNRLSECEHDSDTSPTTPIRPQLSPITENKVISKSRAGSTHHPHADRQQITRNRKATLTSIGSDMNSTNDLKSSRPNLSRISARSYAQSISRLSQCPQPLKGAQSMVSMAGSLHPKEFSRPMSRRDIFYAGSIKNLPEFEEEGKNYRSYRESQISIPASVAAQAMSGLVPSGDIADVQSRLGGSRMTGGLQPDEEDTPAYYDDSKCKWIPLSVRNTFNEMIDIELLKEPIMMMLCLSNLLGMLGFYVPFMFLIDMAGEKGITKESASLLLSVIGITNTIGRIVSGWVADQGWISALAITNFSLVACGVLTCICPMLPSFAALMGYSVLFGFIISAYICLTSIVLADLLGLDRLTNSFGLLVVSRGIASLLGTPIAGMVYDLTASYDASFYFAGVLIVLAGLASCTIPFIQRRQKRQNLIEEATEYEKDADAISGKLSVVSERSEEYQRTIQSLRAQKKLLDECEAERLKKENQPVTVSEGNEDDEDEPKGDQSAVALIDKKTTA